MGETFDRVAEFYDIETILTEDIPFYVDYAKLSGGPALELGCGTGRVLVPIAKGGIEIWGLDISMPMLEIAKKKIGNLSPVARRRTKLIYGDMKEFKLGRKFPYIFIAFRSFQSLLTKREQGACLDCVFEHLSKNGIFIIDLFAPRHDLLACEKKSLYLGKSYDKEKDIYITRRAEVAYDFVNQTLKEDRFYEWTDKEAHLHCRIWTLEISYLFRYEAELLLEEHGFEIENVFGNFDKSPYDYYSGEQIFVARKR
ncbi:hypothetical protein CH333_07130 [candidate division WOR-3 bacterium JGI_Cruoil_03_44_89]|uniref:Methyltransferase domain-containing protein n=1 Tax=candidate division WOR-3 bacterium JGI_Cruoil_03_44_89 TaxID=1973748 RepID=A0A235BQS2_UNCW3|nr:MAG: hypothetical protein CH333_07130 [candidate division WOR-3 bacterium JGI_Cruoil_03_44_89]